MTLDRSRAEIVALGKDGDGCLVDVQRKGAVDEVEKPAQRQGLASSWQEEDSLTSMF